MLLAPGVLATNSQTILANPGHRIWSPRLPAANTLVIESKMVL